MTNEQDQVWRFFASVKLALALIFILAITSIIGTLLPQHKPPEFYIQEYGSELARLMQALDIPNMYSSWWFITLLIIFAINLIVCSIDRLPNAWRMVVLDNLETGPERLSKMTLKREMTVTGELPAAAERVRSLLSAAGWKATDRDREGNVLLFAQKGAWSRLGAYVIHISILVILIGALVGALFGFKASIMFPEGSSTSHIFDRGTGQPIPLDFELHLENFEITYYPNGMVREFRSDILLTDPAKGEPRRASILVNHPLKHRGLTFYQASYRALPEFLIHVRNHETGQERQVVGSVGRELNWPEEGVSFGVTNAMTDRMGRIHDYRVRFRSPGAEPSIFNLKDKQTVTIQRPAHNYSFYVQQRYATGLQVARDPGVWIVYLGFGLMLCGLYVSFMISHRRIWVHLSPGDRGQTRLLLCGGSNRNKESFDRRFEELAAHLRRDQAIN